MAVLDSFLAILPPSVTIIQMINLSPCHECKSCFFFFLFLLCSTLLFNAPIYIHIYSNFTCIHSFLSISNKNKKNLLLMSCR
ncbi:hypothetical protein HanIR_Chr04g0190281 [Helianthus annuus]|nr:hypothetical protein HanIR_Chr04g0190281 [Helianthus annuus]